MTVVVRRVDLVHVRMNLLINWSCTMISALMPPSMLISSTVLRVCAMHFLVTWFLLHARKIETVSFVQMETSIVSKKLHKKEISRLISVPNVRGHCINNVKLWSKKCDRRFSLRHIVVVDKHHTTHLLGDPKIGSPQERTWKSVGP